ncbi:hypothetical protein [Streptomyces sp. AK02-01A]|uniref:hypothetical protein n=1 Tax=Streptomyces sp. AK02-01A TaxID=3028648 RepID=UPI0029AFE66F|nr:hypothetical protein [Streptomyces sp. AK02-01A]MDX3855669.1 hypothetical protein [Streptomyces sp. AK02-01A]
MAPEVDNPDDLLRLAGRISKYARRLSDPHLHADNVVTAHIEDQIASIADLLTTLAYELIYRQAEAGRFPRRHAQVHRRGTAALARAAQPVGHALGDLGAVVEQLGFLHEIAEYEPTSEHADAVRSANEIIGDRLGSAGSHLNAAAQQLEQDAHRLLDPRSDRKLTRGAAPIQVPAAVSHLSPAPRPPSLR